MCRAPFWPYLCEPLYFLGLEGMNAHEPVLSTSVSVLCGGATSAWWFVDMADQKHLLVGSLVSGISASLFAIVGLLPYWSSSVETTVALGWGPGRSLKWWEYPRAMSCAQGVNPNLSIS